MVVSLSDKEQRTVLLNESMRLCCTLCSMKGVVSIFLDKKETWDASQGSTLLSPRRGSLPRFLHPTAWCHLYTGQSTLKLRWVWDCSAICLDVCSRVHAYSCEGHLTGIKWSHCFKEISVLSGILSCACGIENLWREKEGKEIWVVLDS